MFERNTKREFEQLTKPHIQGLWRVAFRMTGERELAEDLTQEACLRAYKAFDSFEPSTNYQAWLYRILTNLCRDNLRRNRRSPFVPVSDEFDEPIGVAPISEQPEAHLIRKNFRNDLAAAIDKLPTDVRLVVALSLLRELSYDEIAAVAGCPVGTVRSRLHRGRQQLQRDLEDYVATSNSPLKLVSEKSGLATNTYKTTQGKK